MAKKTVASLQKGEGRTYSKIIKMVKSPKTGAYMFEEKMVPNDAVKDALKYARILYKISEKPESALLVDSGFSILCMPCRYCGACVKNDQSVLIFVAYYAGNT